MSKEQSQRSARQAQMRIIRGKPTPGIEKREPRTTLRRCKRLEEIWEKRLLLQLQEKEEEHGCTNLDISRKENTRSPRKTSTRKRKLPQDIEVSLRSNLGESRRKRVRISTVKDPVGEKPEVGGVTIEEDQNPVLYWTRRGRWPQELFQQDERTREYLNRDLDAESWFNKYWEPNMSQLLAKKKSSDSIRRQQSESGTANPSNTTPSDQKPREVKTNPYVDSRYGTLLSTKNVFMNEAQGGPTKDSKSLCRLLLEEQQKVPDTSRFSNEVFHSTCSRIQDRNEAKVVQDITRLIVPSAEELADFGDEKLVGLTESVNEGWNNSIPVTKTRPQPDYAVGFGREAFTAEQLKKLEPFVGGLFDLSYFMATYYMYFPFLTSEVKCGAAALDIADRQNAHSMTLAVRAVVELFRLVKREKEVDREILAFSISHDHCSVRIYGHYAVVEGSEQKYYRHAIHKFDFTALDGKEKWTAYKFTKNIYDTWMPKHFERLCSVIKDIPSDVNFDVSHSELQFSEQSGLSQDLGAYSIEQSSVGSALVEDDPSIIDDVPNTPNTSVTEVMASKRPKRERAGGGRKRQSSN